MLGPITRGAAVGIGVLAVALLVTHRSSTNAASATAVEFPAALVDVRDVSRNQTETAVFAGGCFWGIEAVFEHVKGVVDAVSGYAGGAADSAEYETVSSGRTGHAESVRVTFDPSQITYGKLLEIFFSVAHDPTELNRQGPDVGPQYRSAVFYADSEQARVARAYIDQLNGAKVFDAPIVTQVTPLRGFFPAEAYHQNYLVRHPNELYIVINDRPKLVHLREKFPALYREKAAHE